ncbi:MAG: ABC transporter permease [Candidatus Pacebacteria bacterium]|nr:ABC transporter permease [Candidatus Paceibacterota bacterium]
MSPAQMWISYYTIVRKDTMRILRLWAQTFLPSGITSVLYFTVFGTILGSKIGEISGVDYIQFVVPGLVMLNVITNAYSNVATTFFTSKFFARSIDEILVSPTPPWVLIAGFVSGGVVRGFLVGILVLLVSLIFAIPSIAHPLIVLLFLLLASLLFSLGGLINGIYAKSFDGISIVPTFVLTPLVYLGGVFYSTTALPGWAQTLSHFNPVFYIINGFRYGFLGFADVSIVTCVAVLSLLIAIFVGISYYFLRTGLGLRQ